MCHSCVTGSSELMASNDVNLDEVKYARPDKLHCLPGRTITTSVNKNHLIKCAPEMAT